MNVALSAIMRPQVGALGDEPTPRKLRTNSGHDAARQDDRELVDQNAGYVRQNVAGENMHFGPPPKLEAAWT